MLLTALLKKERKRNVDHIAGFKLCVSVVFKTA